MENILGLSEKFMSVIQPETAKPQSCFDLPVC